MCIIKNANRMYGLTGGFQPVQGSMFGNYGIGSLRDMVVESFAGTHDYLGGQIWGHYNKEGNTSRNRTTARKIGAETTTYIAIPVSAPFAVADLLDNDLLLKIFK